MVTEATRVLLLNGCPAIHHCVYGSGQNTQLFLDRMRFLLVRKGSCKIQYGAQAWELRRNEMALVSHSLLLEFRTGEASPQFSGNQYLFFDLPVELVQEFVGLWSGARPGGDAHPAIVTAVADEKLLSFAETLDAYFADSAKWSGPLIRLKLLELLFFLGDSAPTLLDPLLAMRKTFRTDIRATVEENIANGLSLRELASLTGRSLSSFTRDFQAIYNVSPSRWIRQRRLEKAWKLLTSTSMSVTDIGYSLGFESLTNFCRLFKTYYGCRPLECRDRSFVECQTVSV